jgi:hypothetical protein
MQRSKDWLWKIRQSPRKDRSHHRRVSCYWRNTVMDHGRRGVHSIFTYRTTRTDAEIVRREVRLVDAFVDEDRPQQNTIAATPEADPTRGTAA